LLQKIKKRHDVSDKYH